MVSAKQRNCETRWFLTKCACPLELEADPTRFSGLPLQRAMFPDTCNSWLKTKHEKSFNSKARVKYSSFSCSQLCFLLHYLLLLKAGMSFGVASPFTEAWTSPEDLGDPFVRMQYRALCSHTQMHTWINREGGCGHAEWQHCRHHPVPHGRGVLLKVWIGRVHAWNWLLRLMWSQH